VTNLGASIRLGYYLLIFKNILLKCVILQLIYANCSHVFINQIHTRAAHHCIKKNPDIQHAWEYYVRIHKFKDDDKEKQDRT
jgi:hypothetical protein